MTKKYDAESVDSIDVLRTQDITICIILSIFNSLRGLIASIKLKFILFVDLNSLTCILPMISNDRY